MSCACEHKKMSGDLERIRKLAKAFALMEEKEVVIYRQSDGTYGFTCSNNEIDKPIIEYISPY